MELMENKVAKYLLTKFFYFFFNNLYYADVIWYGLLNVCTVCRFVIMFLLEKSCGESENVYAYRAINSY